MRIKQLLGKINLLEHKVKEFETKNEGIISWKMKKWNLKQENLQIENEKLVEMIEISKERFIIDLR